ncbi:hypothetical protein LV779_27840 [Streptomyces thinghirensis]|nr:hypothetical protein [Streptomyces thinghirensis]
MVGEGIEPASVEQAAAQAGCPGQGALPDGRADPSRCPGRSARRPGGPWRRRAAPGPRTPPRPSSTAWSTSSNAPGAAAAPGSTSTGTTAGGQDSGRACGSTSTKPGYEIPFADSAGAHALLRRRSTRSSSWRRAC